jgi:regulator of replication initiation timing
MASRRKRINDAIVEMQSTINMLVEKNAELYKEVMALRRENAELKQEIAVLNEKLKDVKTITKRYNNDNAGN